ncbi:hypothetical protein AG1IA_10351 [Rhizoctonia solani AG-1 IA]|uniref:Uncharacterized protein n=1 Tax=Thanatephorus cucumeris (strain AG1-IA) TaxID=983506 RepID=L8WGV0_THACA|nr:hypothetical protein AG1IA_10351 [Rhizoctonia solani AG-1 IA]
MVVANTSTEGCEYMLTKIYMHDMMEHEQWVCANNSSIGSYDLRPKPYINTYR